MLGFAPRVQWLHAAHDPARLLRDGWWLARLANQDPTFDDGHVERNRFEREAL